MIYTEGAKVTVKNPITCDYEGYEVTIWPGEELNVIEDCDTEIDDDVYVEYTIDIPHIYMNLHIDTSNIETI